MSNEKSNIEESFKNSDWSSICAELMPHFNDYLARHSKNVFECEQVNTLDHVFTVPALYDDMAGVRKQVIVPMKIFTRGVDAAVEDVKKATAAANTAAGKANDAAASVTQATTDIAAERKKVDEAVAASKTATTNANTAATNAGEATEASKAQTELAKELNEHPQMHGENGNWWKWNTETKEYEDTGIIARGGMMYPTFEIFDNELYVTDAGSNIEERIALEDNELILKL